MREVRTAGRLASRMLARLGIGAFGRPSPRLETRERDGWFWGVAGPAWDKIGNVRFEAVMADADNYFRRWACVIPAACAKVSGLPRDWDATLASMADAIAPNGAFEPPRLPAELPGSPGTALPWHAVNYVIGEFASGAMLNGKAISAALAARAAPHEAVRAADRLMRAKPGAEIGSKALGIMNDPAYGRAARDLARAWPWAAYFPPADFKALVRLAAADATVPDLKGIALALSRTGPWTVTSAALSRFDAFAPETRSALRDERVLVDIMSSIPPSWLFAADEDFIFLSRIARAVDRLCPIDPEDVATFFGASKGRFREFVSSALGTDPDDPETASAKLDDISDFLSYVRDEVVTAPLRQEVAPDEADVIRARPNGRHKRHLLATAKLVATPDGGLGRLKDLSDRWHANLSDYPFPMSVNGRGPWPRLADDWKAPNGITVTVLDDAGALENEAAAMRHCVRSFRRRCEVGESSVVSLRRDGVRLSTAEIGYENRGFEFSVRQHRGPSNADPSPECHAALAAWHKAISKGGIPVNPDIYRPGAFHVRDLPEFDVPPEGPAAFRGIVERRLTEMDWNGFAEAVRQVNRTARRRIRASLPQADPSARR